MFPAIFKIAGSAGGMYKKVLAVLELVNRRA
jgi:hypothetical protein